MTIEQTVEIPPSHRLTIDVPREVPAGPVILTFTPAGETRPDYTPPAKGVEPFASEREALDFANNCAERLLHETR